MKTEKDILVIKKFLIFLVEEKRKMFRYKFHKLLLPDCKYCKKETEFLRKLKK